MNIYLVGMMGSGKTVTGKALASLTAFQFIDLDRKIEREQSAAINSLFETRGEAFFRNLETAALLEVSKGSKQIISTGGGVVLREKNRQVMKSSGQVVFLETSLSWLIKRLKGSVDRPLLKTENWMEKAEILLKERTPLYRQTASAQVMTDEKTAAQVALEIAVILGINKV
jgi:shikimate kinase